MTRTVSLFFTALSVVFVLSSCSKEDNPVGPGGGGLTTINFADASPSVSISAGAGATPVVLTGGTLPYAIQSAPDPSVAAAVLSGDTLTIVPAGAGSTSVTVSDASPAKVSGGAVRLVTISIIVQGGEGGGVSPFDFPIPDIAGINGGVGVVHLNSTVYGDLDYGIGVFEGPGGASFVYGGAVTVNGTSIDSLLLQGNVFYMEGLASGVVHFDNSSTTSFNVAGAGAVPAFTGSIVAPTVSQLTAPANAAAVSRSSNLTVAWNGTGSDSIIVVVSDFSGNAVMHQGLTNNGSYTVTAAELGTLDAGQGVVHVVKYRYNIVTAGSQHYVVLAESDSFAFITLN